MDSKKLTLSNGSPYYEHQDSQTVGPRGPVLMQDFILQENLAHFVRERIPERTEKPMILKRVMNCRNLPQLMPFTSFPMYVEK